MDKIYIPATVAEWTEEQRLRQILDITYNLIFTSVNLTVKQKEMLAEIRELSGE